MPLINQFSPYSCVLDCWANFLTESGFPITTQGLLTYHRDLCWHNPPEHNTYGSLDKDQFHRLARRFLCSSADIANPILKNMGEALKKDKNGIFAFSPNHAAKNINHCCRVIRVKNNKFEIFDPSLPYGNRISASLGDMINNWKSVFVHVTIP